jgi:hypothetical protein
LLSTADLTLKCTAAPQLEQFKDMDTHSIKVGQCFSGINRRESNPNIDGNYGARLLRLIKVNHFSVHDIALVDGKFLTYAKKNNPNPNL